MLSDLGRDVRYAIRSLLRTPTFTVTVIVTLSLGLGANAVIFSAVDAVLLRDAPVSNPDSLVNVFTTSGNNRYSSSSYPDYFDLRDSGTFAALAAYTPVSITLDAKGTPEPLAGQLVTGNYFEALGVNAAVGRGLVPDDDQSERPFVSQSSRMRSGSGCSIATTPRSARRSVSTATCTRSSGSRHQGSWARPSAWRPTSGSQPPCSPKWIPRRRPCGARVVTRRSSTCAVRAD